jgi:putative (di)nucleoside polyphosphate hydrolase
MKLPEQYFRAGVGAVIINEAGHILSLERIDIPGEWQLPQGGLKSAEEPLRAAFREVAEETGIDESDLELLDSYPEPLAYELPLSARNAKTGRGQVQYWLLFRLRGRDNTIDVEKGAEFRAWKWMAFESVIKLAVGFRKPVYRKLADRFSSIISRQTSVDA